MLRPLQSRARWEVTDTSGLRIKLEAAQHRIADLEELLRRWSDCREAHATGGGCAEDHTELVLETDSALAGGKD